MPGETEGVSIDVDGRGVLLKWHKLRRSRADPPFALANLRAGLAAGAALEIDIRVLADDGWVVLHDAVLDKETDGKGRVIDADAASIRRLRIAGTEYAPLLIADIAHEIGAAPETGACLQLDLKEKPDAISRAAAEAFAEAIGPVAGRCLLSGTGFEAVERLGAAFSSLRLGFDPLELAKRYDLADRESIEALLEETADTAPAAACYYLEYRLVLRAIEKGVDPIGRLKERGARVDVWTLDPTTPAIERVLPAILAAGADQITTNDPVAMARLWMSLAEGARHSPGMPLSR